MRPTIAGITAVLGEFQKVFTSVYHALKNGPKMTAKVSAESTDATAFGFAYTFAGSVGVMMTLQNERVLSISESDLDEAMSQTLALLSTTEQSDLQEMAERVGLPALRHAHHWALENAKAGFGADIFWQRETAVRQRARVQSPQIEKLASYIQLVAAREEIAVIGDLMDVSLTEKTFVLKLRDKTITGHFTTAISEDHPASLPRRYRARLRVTQRVVTPGDQDEQTYLLLGLEPVDPSTALLSDFSAE